MREKSGPLAARVATIAARQHGVISRAQLLGLGVSSATIARWVSVGHLHRLYPGVYAVGHRRISREGEWMAAVLACGAGSFLSYGSSGQLTGILSRRERIALHVSVARRRDANPPGIVVHRPRSLDPRDTTQRFNIPTTTATRALWDLASILPSLQARRAFEQAEKLGLLDRTRLVQLYEASPSRKGAATIRQLLGERPLPLSETRSWLEELLLIICRDNDLPLPAINVPLLGYEVDFLWPDARFVVEADGGDHLRPAQRDRDNARDAALGRAGYLVRRYSYRAMGRREAVAAEVLEILGERLPAAESRPR